MAARTDSSDALSPLATQTLLERRGRFLDFLTRRLGSGELAEEVLQEAYARALERGGQLRDDETVVAWFFRILRNAVLERARRQSAAARPLEALSREMATASAEAEVERAVCTCVGGVLGTLKPEYQASLRAIDLDGQDLRSFASNAGITPNNAAVRVHRAREALAKRLRATCGACAAHGCIDCTCGTRE
jgi:RNA polymerase sigma-70 factor (ECF subfamily)